MKLHVDNLGDNHWIWNIVFEDDRCRFDLGFHTEQEAREAGEKEFAMLVATQHEAHTEGASAHE
jgi:hypothetical protein